MNVFGPYFGNKQHISMNVNNIKENPKLELEDQFILRLPMEQAKTVRKILKKKPKKIKKYLTIEMENDLRHGIVRVHKSLLNAKLFDLPSIVESNKTMDKVHLFKTADICQILLCQEAEFQRVVEEKENKDKTKVNKAFLYPHGLTSPMKNCRKLRFRKTLRNKDDVEEAADIEKEVLWLLRMDNEAVSTKFEFVDYKLNVLYQNQHNTISELSIFGETLSDIESEKESCTGSISSNSEINDIMDFTN